MTGTERERTRRAELCLVQRESRKEQERGRTASNDKVDVKQKYCNDGDEVLSDDGEVGCSKKDESENE